MQIEYLKECVALAETLNFTLAAKRFYITQPVLSRHIAAVEQEMDVRIFLRTKHKVELTAIGEKVIEDMRQVIADYENMLIDIRNANVDGSDQIRFGYLEGAVGHLLTQAQIQFARIYPKVGVIYRSYEFLETHDALVSDDIDLAIEGLGRGELESDEFMIEELFVDSLYAVIDKRHPLARRKSLKPEDLRNQIMLAPAPGFLPRHAAAVSSYFDAEANGIDQRDILVDSKSLSILLQSGNYIGVSPGHLSRYYPDSIVFVPLEDFPFELVISAVWNRRHDSDYLRAFVEVLKDLTRDEPHIRISR